MLTGRQSGCIGSANRAQNGSRSTGWVQHHEVIALGFALSCRPHSFSKPWKARESGCRPSLICRTLTTFRLSGQFVGC